MIHADDECPACGDPGPPRLVWSSDDPDEIDEVQCRVCGHHYYPGDVPRRDPASCDPDYDLFDGRTWPTPPVDRRRRAITRKPDPELL